jgi:Tfp pilus assembly protein PilO
MFHKSKIITGIAVWLVITLALFLYGFRILDHSNQTLADQLLAQKNSYRQLEAEQRSYQLGKKDLEALAQKSYQPSDFFSNDTKLVKEITSLEALAGDYGLDFRLQVSGTIDSAIKSPGAAGPIVLVPFSISVSGPFAKVVDFMDQTEHLAFILHVKALSVSAADKGNVATVMSGNFFLIK